MENKEEKKCFKCGNPIPTNKAKCIIDKNYYCDKCTGQDKKKDEKPFYKLI